MGFQGRWEQRLATVEMTSTQDRLNFLAEKANDGVLTVEEQYEYEQYVEGIDLLGIFKAQARLALLRLTA